MNIKSFLIAGLVTFIPIAELRGGIPVALSLGILPLWAYFYCVIVNMLVAPLGLLFLETLHRKLMGWNRYRIFFEKFILKARGKVGKKVERFGYLGLALFVAIPLPITGAYTGILGAWVLNLDRKKSVIAISAGVVISGLLVMGAVYLAGMGYDFFRFFFKETC